MKMNTETKHFRGSLLDLVGGRSPLPATEPSVTDAQSIKAVRWMRFSSVDFWPACGPETLVQRLDRLVGALGRVGDLLG